MSGVTYSIPCPKCGRIHEVTYGTSMICTNRALTVSSLYHGGRPLLEYIIKSKSIRDKTFELLYSGYSLNEGYCYSTYYCSKCKKIFTRFHFSLSNDTDRWEPEYHCWHCKKTLSCIMQKDINDTVLQCKCGFEFKVDLNSCPEPENWS